MITVGIPAYNEEETVAKTIESVLRQISKKDEILVVDNGSKDNTASEIKKIQKKDKRVKLLMIKKNKGKVPALNLILKKAKSEIIVQTDADVILAEDSIKNLIKHFKDKKVGAVSGNPIPVISKSSILYDWTIMSYRKIHEIRIKQDSKGNFWHISGYLCAFRKKALEKMPIDVKGSVDGFMGQMIKSKGYKIVYEPKAKVFVKCPETIKDFIAQKARVRTGYYYLYEKFGEQPRTLSSEFFYLPREILKVNILRWPIFLFSGLIYLYSWLKGGWFFKTKKPLHEVWKTPKTTKTWKSEK